MDYKDYERKFRKNSTKYLIERYNGFNDDFRRIARDEFKKRKVPASKLPYKKRTVTKKNNMWNRSLF